MGSGPAKRWAVEAVLRKQQHVVVPPTGLQGQPCRAFCLIFETLSISPKRRPSPRRRHGCRSWYHRVGFSICARRRRRNGQGAGQSRRRAGRFGQDLLLCVSFFSVSRSELQRGERLAVLRGFARPPNPTVGEALGRQPSTVRPDLSPLWRCPACHFATAVCSSGVNAVQALWAGLPVASIAGELGSSLAPWERNSEAGSRMPADRQQIMLDGEARIWLAKPAPPEPGRIVGKHSTNLATVRGWLAGSKLLHVEIGGLQ